MRLTESALLLPALVLVLCGSLFAGEYTKTITFTSDDLTVTQRHGLDFVVLKDGVPSGPVGAPALPVVQFDVAIPWTALVQQVSIVRYETVDLDGTFDVAPLTQPRITSGKDKEENPFVKDGAIYGNDAFYPGDLATRIGGWKMVGQRFAKIALHPVQYNPVSGQLKLATLIEFRVEWIDASNQTEQKTVNLSKTGRDHYETLLKEKAVNPSDVIIPSFAGSKSRALPSGQYEHVIITPQTYESDWAPLADWRTQKGCPSIIITREYIDANYSGNSRERIRNFVDDAHTTWGARFFLLGADGGTTSSRIPYHERYLLGEDVPNDTFYSDLDGSSGDWVADVSVGRATVRSSTHIDDFIDKVFYYERTPVVSNYGKTVLFLGFDLDSSTDGEDTKIYIDNNYIPSYIDFSREYDSEGGSHLGDTIDYMNDGPNLVNHIDHCNYSVWGMGYVNHSDLMDSGHVNALNNGWKLMNFYTLGCLASAWDYTESLSETIMRRPGNAGVSFTGNTRYGWYAVGYWDLYSSLYEIRWWHVLFTDNDYHVGDTLKEHKNDYYPSDEYYQYIFTELNLLGDPAMPLWTDDPDSLSVTHDDPINTGSQSYSVNVKSGGSNLQGALVCVWKDTEVYDYDTTNSSGNASFTIDPVTAGTLLLTITAQNHLPYEATVTVDANSPPVITDVTPEDGGVAGGTAVTITGSNFTNTADTDVYFGGTAASSVVVVDSSTITCDTPAHAAGAVDVEVANSNGFDTAPNAFTYHDAPSISDVDPDNGPAAGGTAVTITGSDFTTAGSTTVTFGGAAASDVTVVNTTTITCTTPAHGGGDVDVAVTNDFGSDTLNNGFRFNNAPDITSIDPTNGPAVGGTAVTIYGSDFTTSADTDVDFGGAAASDVVVVDQSTITCTTPAHAAGAVDVEVTNSNGSDTLPSAFTYHNAPSISGVDPDEGPVGGGTFATITGSDFTTVGSTTVTFGGTAASGVTVVNATTITCTTPAHSAGSVDVEVSNDFGTDTLNNGFAYHNPPVISWIDPVNGPAAGGTSVTVHGNDFTSSGDTDVYFGGSAASNVVVVNSTTITCTTPGHSAGSVDVEVTNSFGSDTLPGAFTYHNAPSIFDVDPDNGPESGGTAVTISGSDFSAIGTTTVTFGGSAASNVVVVNASTITCTTPAHGAGAVNVVVTNDFGSDTLYSGFTYNGAPVVNSIDPEHGSIFGGLPVTISGAAFTSTADTDVYFDGDAAANVVVVNSTTITCDTPGHAAGTVGVEVVNSNGSDTLPGCFTYHNPPSIADVDPDNGPTAGGTLVTISGSDFTSVGTTTVTFGGANATGITFVNSTTMTCYTPAQVAGTVDVVVTNDFGTDTLGSGFTYNLSPVVSTIDPEHGPAAGGTAVTIEGDNFTDSADTDVYFDGAAASNVVVVDPNTITCDTPAQVAGLVDVEVTNSNGSDTLAGCFTYHNAPAIATIAPDSGPQAGGTAVTITGSDFTTVGTTAVTFDTEAATDVVVVNATTITCTTPAHSEGSVDVTVTNDFGSDTLNNGFTYELGDPVPDIKVNGEDDDFSVSYPTELTITISLDPGNQAGVTHDYWINAEMNGVHDYWWRYPGTWRYSSFPKRAIAYDLVPLTDYQVGQATLPAGTWKFFFAVDALNNIYEGTYQDEITVTID